VRGATAACIGRLSAVEDSDQWRSEHGRDAERRTSRGDDDLILPDSTVDDTDVGWGERPASNDERLLADRPPHWG
jgi:hypothetical protein